MTARLGTDLAVVRDNAGRFRDFANITAQTLLIDETATRPYLRAAVAALAAAIPGAQHVELAGQWHGVTSNAAEHGRPHLVAPVLAEFFASPAALDPLPLESPADSAANGAN